MSYKPQIAVIGAGHAGIESALAAAKLGCEVVLFTLSLDTLANMPCNPSIGGTGKGHLVFEIDALGGVMGKVADMVMLQSRMLNSSKGPAVRSLRFQADRQRYHKVMKQLCENQKHLRLVQTEIVGILFEAGKVVGVKTVFGQTYECEAVIIATGTYLDSSILVGDKMQRCGPDNSKPALELSECLTDSGIKLNRFKTGTPARIHRGSIDFSRLEVQSGDERFTLFSKDTDRNLYDSYRQHDCYIAYTNENTHKIIRDNIHKSAMYSGLVTGTGARYCPSIEDKIIRFADKERHQLFIEPMGTDTSEMYIQGLSTSFPEDIQEQIIHSISGLEDAVVMRYAYAIEYECIDPTQLSHTLEFRDYEGLYGAGQFNGTSGYEEAAAQGLVAGINAALKISGKEQIIFGRDNSYIGMLIDDLVIKGTNEPYRVMTSRTEFRLLLRQDNADERLTSIGYNIGLISQNRYNKFQNKLRLIEEELQRIHDFIVTPTDKVNALLLANNSSPIVTGIRFIELLRRPELNYDNLFSLYPNQPDNEIAEQVQIRVKYEGYIKRQLAEVEKFKKLESKKIPAGIDYTSMKGLRIEAIQKLERYRPENIGEASRISGISPADITVLLIILSKNRE